MGFLKRLGWYLVGLSIGIVFLAFFFKKKSEETGTSFCYFPNCRVLKDIRSKPIAFSANEKDTVRFDALETNIQSVLRDGSIDFGKSDTKSEPCKTYFITKDDIELQLKNCPDRAIIEKVRDIQD